jgi:hypothetical protein
LGRLDAGGLKGQDRRRAGRLPARGSTRRTRRCAEMRNVAQREARSIAQPRAIAVEGEIGPKPLTLSSVVGTNSVEVRAKGQHCG